MQESILQYFQNIATPFLDSFFTYSTMLGEQYFIILIITLVYWNISKKNGFILTYTFVISTIVNVFLKNIFHTERPYQKLDNIEGKRVHTGTGYSFPSGHTQGATTVFVTLALFFKRNIYMIIAVSLSILVAISRVYLGVHWPIDVLGGVVFGIAISILLYWYLNKIYDNKKLFYKVIVGLIIIAYLFFFVLMIINSAYFNGELKITDTLKILGVATGAVVGFILQEEKFAFKVENSVGLKTIRYIFGVFMTIVFMLGLKYIFPEAKIFSWIRYIVIGFWISAGLPYIGLKMKLFKKE